VGATLVSLNVRSYVPTELGKYAAFFLEVKYNMTTWQPLEIDICLINELLAEVLKFCMEIHHKHSDIARLECEI
jgi:hypothetical protein